MLVIDDDATTRDSLRRLLTSWGYDCAAFDAGDPALRFLGTDGVGKRWIVLLDYRLAGRRCRVHPQARLAIKTARDRPSRMSRGWAIHPRISVKRNIVGGD
ncbi:response regulator [Bradyrhizobium sp. CCBAU 51627]|uniref:response regulator n=1 Tax=Bradyrhizobium sp. CCBAU 51627 TaxID=1325088 RepID=UPI002306414E|nr:response regulator [Bradyrhizobium sp. CCBAU 51627]